ncbi:probable ATP-dependent RNA helicase DHX34 isoform X2 [Teleopsis dalmanni]|uniref:probable ATP-dependent RNA helicase DHX34 isoform X2 n=1 Tax=Teleopsis dalmanni TaxID=139649 RepID=UPI0018CFDAD6|nr:probable ATP-dependent RNA helicase DHX34 isoform X2 [Teleopsis dalmanni]
MHSQGGKANYSFFEDKLNFGQHLHNEQFQIVEKESEFWQFVIKYENMLKNCGQQILSYSWDNNKSREITSYHKQNFITISLHRNHIYPFEKGTTIVTQFKNIVLLYLDFKQKKKFSKIKKLRKDQRSLPVTFFKKTLFSLLPISKIIIIAGDTGCGKSTQVPQYLYEFGYRNIACTQPRRLACVSLSQRVSHEMLDDYGTKVGFHIRFENNKTPYTNIVFTTEGLLLRQLAAESNLHLYDVIMLDEIHERNLYGDILLGVIKCILCTKLNIKLILMSATINISLFQSYFKKEDIKLIKIPGRLYPIKTIYITPPYIESKAVKQKIVTQMDPKPFIQVLSLIDQKYPSKLQINIYIQASERGDVLIFVSGINDITTISEAAKEYAERNSHWIILPLHSGLALADQNKVFEYAPEGFRKCIVSTNIAETSLTVDSIRFVIDSGKVKQMSYDASCKGQRLKEFWVSKSSAEQRKGRAGRTGPGTCFRLYTEKQFNLFDDYLVPEIFRVPLDTIVLQMIAMGLPNIRAFPFIEKPSGEKIEQTIMALKQHNALAADEKITPLGKALSNLPVDISIGKMLLLGSVFSDIKKILTLAAIISVQNPFTNCAYKDVKCKEERTKLESDQGDTFTVLRVFREWIKLKIDQKNTWKWCHKLGIEEQRFYEVCKLRNQFQNILQTCNFFTIKNENTMSSADRSQRHGEICLLKALKRKHKYQKFETRKILKMNSINNAFERASDDIRDVNFRLSHDSNKLEVATIEKLQDLLVLKTILVSGFYPKIAIADDFNYCKTGNQQLFHTSLKPYISIHPNSYFAKFFNIFKLNDDDEIKKPYYYTSKNILSTKHQILCFQNLLETTKPYIMNCIRIPAAHILLLFAYSIDTNLSLTRMVCDSWLCLEFPVAETGSKLLRSAIKLRRLWSQLFAQILTAYKIILSI